MSFLVRRFLIFICLLSVVSYSFFLASPVAPNSDQQLEFVIQKGQSLDQITNNLKRSNLIRSSSVAKLAILINRISKDIQAGYFYLSPSSSTHDIVRNLTKASTKQVWITIPEGLRRQEVALTIEKALNQSGADHNFSIQDFISMTKDLEGHLFPETYAFDPDVSSQAIVNKLVNQLDKAIQSISIPLEELESTLILASLVEREAGDASEMLEIAGILKKRLNADWPLQIDATIQFVMANKNCTSLTCDYWANNISRSDLDIPSPYNTYKYSGLPAGPIASPGLEAIKASFQASSSDYWFYIHDLKGRVHFAKTLEQHNQNICTYLKKDCS